LIYLNLIISTENLVEPVGFYLEFAILYCEGSLPILSKFAQSVEIP